MIPLHLKLSGFLSYRQAAEVDFTTFHLACISGSNGAGKSSLLDAMTWALFGQARKRDDSLVNLQSKTAEVAFTFSYEGNIYRVQRSLPRGKTTTLEFQVLDVEDPAGLAEGGNPGAIPDGQWRVLTEHSTRETQASIEKVLRLDYDTFTNVSFFLQGRADQFAQQPPSRRKEILGSILGLETWEEYRERAAERRKVQERRLDSIDGGLLEIEAELGEEPARKAHLAELETELESLVGLRKMHENNRESIQKTRALLDNQANHVARLVEALERKRDDLAGLSKRLGERQAERVKYADTLGRKDAVEAGYAGWQKMRQELEHLETVASQFHEEEKRRQPFLDEINAEKARLEQEQTTLQAQAKEIKTQEEISLRLATERTEADASLAEVEASLQAQASAIQQAQEAREKQASLRAENAALKADMDVLEARRQRLADTEGATCPLCGQALSPQHRQSTLEQLVAEGTEKGDRHRANSVMLKELVAQISQTEADGRGNAALESRRLHLTQKLAQLNERLEGMQKQAAEWEKTGAKRLQKISAQLDQDDFALPWRKKLAKVDKELAALGYDAAAHEAARREEVLGRAYEAELRTLEGARSALGPLEDEIANLGTQIAKIQAEIDEQGREHAEAAAELAATQATAPNLAEAEQALFGVKERENRLNQDVGAARQKVNVLDDLRVKKKRLEDEAEQARRQIGRYKTLERAFGKDGVPALLIEQALPEIESKANELLDRLSDGTMTVRFVTQSAYKDKKRDDLKETLDIQISDGAGVREYEMYSGGEAFRVNFAIRLALSEVLASRKGARLQMLVIDEGFGSQDEQGRQRLIQSIKAVQDDFAKILVITHLEALKDAFPTRIEVEKGEGGSVVLVT